MNIETLIHSYDHVISHVNEDRIYDKRMEARVLSGGHDQESFWHSLVVGMNNEGFRRGLGVFL